MCDLNESFSVLFSEKPHVDKRQFLMEKIQSGECISQTAKTPWTLTRLEKASDATVDKLYASYKDISKINPNLGSLPNSDIISRIAGVDSVEALKDDLNKNHFMQKLGGSMNGFLPNMSVTPVEQIGAYAYARYSGYIAPISIFCTIFNHLDWNNFSRIVEANRIIDTAKTSDIVEDSKNIETPLL